jgi:hypothetical protein
MRFVFYFLFQTFAVLWMSCDMLCSTNQMLFYSDTANKMELNYLKVKCIFFYILILSFFVVSEKLPDHSRPQFHLSPLGVLTLMGTWRHPVAKVGTSKGRGKRWQTTPKNLPRMQRARAIPVAWLGSGSWQNRPKGWILMMWLSFCTWDVCKWQRMEKIWTKCPSFCCYFVHNSTTSVAFCVRTEWTEPVSILVMNSGPLHRVAQINFRLGCSQ